MRIADHPFLSLTALAAASCLGLAWSNRDNGQGWRRQAVGGIWLAVLWITMFWLFMFAFFYGLLSGPLITG
jgi:hypothetical protein